jgi:hypothetical protein
MNGTGNTPVSSSSVSSALIHLTDGDDCAGRRMSCMVLEAHFVFLVNCHRDYVND